MRLILRVGFGEGLFLKRHIEKQTVVAFYNGVRLDGMEPEDVSWDERSYRIFLSNETRMDIPEDMRDTRQYKATLAHKIQHSFDPNCEFWEYWHPVHGLIPCVRTLQVSIRRREEENNHSSFLGYCWRSGADRQLQLHA